MPEDLLQMLQFEQWRYSERAVFTKAAVGAEHMQMRMPSKEIAKRMYCHNGPWNSPLFRYGFPGKFFQDFPPATAEIAEQLSVIEEIATQDFGYTEDEMSARNGLQDFFTQPFPEFHNPLLVTGGAKMSSFA